MTTQSAATLQLNRRKPSARSASTTPDPAGRVRSAKTSGATRNVASRIAVTPKPSTPPTASSSGLSGRSCVLVGVREDRASVASASSSQGPSVTATPIQVCRGVQGTASAAASLSFTGPTVLVVGATDVGGSYGSRHCAGSGG